MGFEPIPRDDPALARRLRRQLMGVASYFMFLLPLAWAMQHGWMDFGWRGMAVAFAIAVAINLVFFVLIRSGASARLRDPSLTFAQIAVAMAMALVVVHFADEARTILLLLFVASLFFGVFGISQREFLFLTICAVAGYAAMAWWETRGLPWSDPRVRMEGLRLLTLAMILLWLSLLGSYVARLRGQLERRNVELGVAMGRLRALASHDELTGVFNRRHLIAVLDREKERADRFGQGFSVCLLDLDHFKQINDTLGHAAGDDVLRGFATRMLACARRMDWVARADPADDDPDEGVPPAANAFGRYGGEEFLLVLPQTNLPGAVRCIDRFRERAQAAPFETVAGPLAATFSAGIAEYRTGEPVADTLARADGALYRAKAGGRNRTEVAG
jgi:GGDEF domain-containing protein